MVVAQGHVYWASLPDPTGFGPGGRDDDIDLETDEIGCELREAIPFTLRVPVLNADVFSLHPSEVPEAFPERLVPARGSGRREWR